MRTEILRTQWILRIRPDEARYILTTLTGKGIMYSALRERVPDFAEILASEGYFVGANWHELRWQETDFVISKNPGPVNDRIGDLEEDERRMIMPDWWVQNIRDQLKVLDLWLSRPVKVAAVHAPLVRHPLLRLTEYEARVFRDALPCWEAGVSAEEAEAALGAGLYQTLLGHTYLLPHEIEGWVQLNLPRFAETLFGQLYSKIQSRVDSEVGPLPAPDVTLVRRLGRLLKSFRQFTTATALPPPAQEVVAAPAQKVRVLFLSVREMQYMLDNLPEWEQGTSRSNVQHAYGTSLLRTLCDELFLISSDDGGLLTLNRAAFAATDLQVWNGSSHRLIRTTPTELVVKSLEARLVTLLKRHEKRHGIPNPA